jgi:hypothetical protein
MILEACDYNTARMLHKRWHSLSDADHQLFWTAYLEESAPSFLCRVGPEVVGVLMFGAPTGEAQEPGDIELRGFALSDEAPRNAGSMAIAQSARLLRSTGARRMVTYSIAEHFDMAVYKASGFSLLGIEDWGHFKVAKWMKVLGRRGGRRAGPSGA